MEMDTEEWSWSHLQDKNLEGTLHQEVVLE